MKVKVLKWTKAVNFILLMNQILREKKKKTQFSNRPLNVE